MLDVAKILEELKQEKEQLEQAIITLERLAQGRTPRRGRPPAWMSSPERLFYYFPRQLTVPASRPWELVSYFWGCLFTFIGGKPQKDNCWFRRTS